MLKKILSHIWPFSKKIKSDKSGLVEVVWVDGKKMLDSETTNYSYGTLLEVLLFGLDKIKHSPQGSSLILGLGGGSVIEALRENYRYIGPIIGVDFDQKMIEIAANEFGISEDEYTMIVNQDALSYIQQDENKYDLIIVDLFIDDRVPEKFYSIEFWQQIKIHLSTKGAFIFNAGMYAEDSSLLTSISNYFSDTFSCYTYEKVAGTNCLLIGRSRV